MADPDTIARVQDAAGGLTDAEFLELLTVTYMNMDFPDFLPQAGTPDYADAAAPDLAQVLAGVKTTAADENNLTVLGHSYGSLTSSEALQNGGRVDNVVFYGSPGLESSAEKFDPASLGVPEGSRYVMLARDDLISPVSHVGPFGGAPVEVPGLTRLDTNYHPTLPDGSKTEALNSSSGHSEYDNQQTTSPWNMAAIATGAPENAILFDESKQTQVVDPDRAYVPGLRGGGVR